MESTDYIQLAYGLLNLGGNIFAIIYFLDFSTTTKNFDNQWKYFLHGMESVQA